MRNVIYLITKNKWNYTTKQEKKMYWVNSYRWMKLSKIYDEIYDLNGYNKWKCDFKSWKKIISFLQTNENL